MFRRLPRRNVLRLLGAAIVAACTQALPTRSPAPTATPTATPGPSPTPTATITPTAVTSPTAEPTESPTDSPPAAVADVIYRGGTIITMDPASPRAAAIALAAGRILAVGAEAAVGAHQGQSTKVIDLGGRTLLPGFNDAHCHRIGDRELWGFPTAEDAIAKTLAQGFTSISELFVSQERLDELVALDSAGALRVRVNAYLPVNYLEDKFGVWFGHLQPRQVMSPRVRVAGVKAFADRAGHERAWITTDYPDRPGYRGDVLWAKNEMADLLQPLADDGWTLAIHTAGDAAHDMVLDVLEGAIGSGTNAARHRIEHVMLVRDDQVARMAQLGVVASFQLGWFTTLWTRDWQSVPTWPDQAGRWRDLLDAGVPCVGSTDTPWAPPAGPAMRAIESAVTRRNEGGPRPADWQLAQLLTVDEALNLLTARGAWGTHEEAAKGMLRPGMLADLVILSADPTLAEPTQISEISVLVTIVEGRAEHCAPGSAALCPP